MLCPASLVLPRSKLESVNATVAADYGKVVHAWVETGEVADCNGRMTKKGRRRSNCACDGCTLEKKRLLSSIDREFWWPAGEHEVTFALNLFTLELRYYDGPREDANAWKAAYYGKREWLTGTIDYRGRWKGRPHIDDLKTGKWPVDYRKRQLTSYHLPGWVEEGCPYGELYYRSITQWPREPLESIPWRTGLGDPLTGAALAMHLDDLRWAAENPDVVNPEPIYIGPYDPDRELSICAFCPCRPDYPVAEWLNNYRYRAGEHCLPGMMKRIREEGKGSGRNRRG